MKTIVAIAIVISLIAGVGIGYLVKPVPPPVAPALEGDIEIGYLECVTGGAAFWGAEARATAMIALEEVNKLLEEIGAPWRLKLLLEDTETKPELALEKLKALHAKGIKIFIGFGTSAEVRMCKPYADANELLLVSYGSTAIDLAVKDWVIRLMPTSLTSDSAAEARLAWEQGVEYLIPVWRGDAWGDSVIEGLKKIYEPLGGTVLEGIRYDPAAVEFTAEAASLAEIIKDAIDKYGAENVGVYIVCFEEAKMFLLESLKHDPLEWGIKWYNFDTALTDWVIDIPEIADFYVKSKMLSPIKIAVRTETYMRIQEQVEAELGRRATLYGINGYDMVWLVALALMATQSYDPAAVKEAILRIGETYSGSAGPAPFNEFEDRRARDVAILQVVIEDGKPVWREVGLWEFATDEVKWYPKPVPFT